MMYRNPTSAGVSAQTRDQPQTNEACCKMEAGWQVESGE